MLANAARAAAELAVATGSGDRADAAVLVGWAGAVIDRRHEVLTASDTEVLGRIRSSVAASLGEEEALAAEAEGASLDDAAILTVLDRTLGPGV
jgi:hypothetical protein